MRALSADAPSIRGTGLKAGVLMVRGPGSSKVVELMAVFDALLDKADLPAHFEYGILSLYGELGRNLGSAPLEKLLNTMLTVIADSGSSGRLDTQRPRLTLTA